MSNGHFTKMRVRSTRCDWLKVDFWIQGPAATDTSHSGRSFDQSESRIQDVFYRQTGRKSLAVICIVQSLMRLDVVLSKPYPSVIPGFSAHLFKDNALNDLYGKTLDTFGFKVATMKR